MLGHFRSYVCRDISHLTHCVKHAYEAGMHSVCETHSFRRAADASGMSAEEIAAVVDHIAVNPMAGVEIPGTCGCRKLRVAGRGKGKSGGYRVVTFYTGDMLPVFLITVFSKGEKANLSKTERNQLAGLTKALAAEYETRIMRVGNKR